MPMVWHGAHGPNYDWTTAPPISGTLISPFPWHHRAGVTPTWSSCADKVQSLLCVEHRCFVHKRESRLGYYMHRFAHFSNRAAEHFGQRGGEKNNAGQRSFSLRQTVETRRLPVIALGAPVQALASYFVASSKKKRGLVNIRKLLISIFCLATWINLLTTFIFPYLVFVRV